jgi:SAM-dependent methyltransferase
METEAPSYAFANAHELQPERLRLLAELLDEGTCRLLEARGVQRRWRCLEVGAGAGSVAAWLSRRVAPGGSVLATDLDTSVLRRLEHPNLEVRVHDVLRDELPEREFDLVHARLLLAWLADPSQGLCRMVASLKPGGLLMIEEMDFVSLALCPGASPALERLFARVVDAHHAVLTESHAFDPFCGRRLPGALSAARLVGVGCDGRVSIWQGGQLGARLWMLTLMQLRERLISSGRIPPAEVDAMIELCEDPELGFMSPVTIAAWGQRPA